ncbi:hypothetical protein PCANC_05326 [Puccinia coronata f. sp. avenae]|uniref:Uncharacterized protein n=1 Tax=Puccinia coronata f. sp. avenae TaxID=200324 RepID=A0A2N5VXC8_9BASI|nr:hypothetical protein PCANC_05326 [Puccinia coronata f. sp. avenae]
MIPKDRINFNTSGLRMANGRARAAHGPAQGSPSPKWAGRAGLKLAKVLPSPNPFMKWAAHGLPVGTRKARNPLGTHGLPMGHLWASVDKRQ